MNFTQSTILASNPFPDRNQNFIIPNNCSSSYKIMSCLSDDMNRIRINVCGQHFETYLYVLRRHPKSLLGNDNKRKKFWDNKRKEYYFDHSSTCFEGIFNYYQTGILRKPLFVHIRTFIEALEYFELDEHVLSRFKKRHAILEEEKIEEPNGDFKKTVWNLFDHPHTSRGAKLLSIFSISLIFLSLISFCTETVPSFAGKECMKYVRFNGTDFYTVTLPNFSNEFFLIELVCVLWFSFEFIIRFITCPNKKKFVMSFMNIIDLISVLYMFVTVGIDIALQRCWASKKGGGFLMLRVLRVFRVFKLSRFSKGLKIWTVTLTSSIRELLLILFLLILGGCVFAAILYYAEYDYPGTQITSILEGYWWGVATMTTVGYGDVVPVSPWGKVIAIVCILCGTLGLALPAPIIVANFNRYYKNETGRGVHGDEWE